MTSTNCIRCASPLESGDLRCAVCGDVPEGVHVPPKNERLEKIVLRCDTCGAATRYDARSQGLLCSFCTGLLKSEEVGDPVEQTEAYLPFTVERKEAREALKKWLGRLGFFRPADLISKSRIEDLRPLWWVGWVFDAEALVSWTADSNAGSQRSAWAPHSGQTDLVFDDVLVSASRGLSEKEAYALTPSYNIGGAEPGTGPREDDAVVEAFDVQRSQARTRITRVIHSIAAHRLQQGHIPGSNFRNVHVCALLTGLETRRLAFPAWVMAYRYNDQLFRVVISGQDSAMLKGKAPYSWFRILGVAAGVLLLVLVTVLLGALS
ncbi:MAG: hypothetical protein ABGY71_01975 [bacterium]|jgi:hypothetical protein|nr:hypothetical protein [Planctomycetota bacterium]HIL50991.1 hypothetical protein [Planctomycetota bacterium]